MTLQSSSLRPKNLISKKPSKVFLLTIRPPKVGSRATPVTWVALKSKQIKVLLEMVGTVDYIVLTTSDNRTPHPREQASSGSSALLCSYAIC